MFESGRCPSDLARRPSDLALRTTTLIFSNEEMNHIRKIVKSLQESGFLIKGIRQTKVKNKKGNFFSMLLGTLGVILLGNLLTGKETITASEGATATSSTTSYC